MAKFALEAHALGNLERRDDTRVDLLAGLSGTFARSPILPPGLIEVTIPTIMANEVFQDYGIKHGRPPYEPIFGSCMTAKQAYRWCRIYSTVCSSLTKRR